MWLASFQVVVDKESIFPSLVEESEVVGGEEVGQTVGCFAVFIQVVILGPDRVMEVEMSEKDGVREEGLDCSHGLNCRVVGVVVDVEDEERMGRGSDLEAHDPRGGDDVGLQLTGPFGSFGGDIHHDVRMIVLGRVLGEDGLPVWMLGAAVDVKDGGTLGHLRIGPNLPIIGFLDKNKISGRMHGGSYGKN